MQLAAAATRMPLLFAKYTAAITHNVFFSGPNNPKNCSVPLKPPKIAPYPWGIWTPSNMWFLWHTQVKCQVGILIGSDFFARLINVTNRQTDTQTDHTTPSVARKRVYLLLWRSLKYVWIEGNAGYQMPLNPISSHITNSRGLINKWLYHNNCNLMTILWKLTKYLWHS